MSKYIKLDLAELLELLVLHMEKLNEMVYKGQFRSKNYIKCSNTLQEIQKAILALTDPTDSPVKQ